MREGKWPWSRAWYFSGGPTVSTYTSATSTPLAIASRTSPIAVSWDIVFRLYFPGQGRVRVRLGGEVGG